MQYHEARQTIDGRWNWSTRHDGKVQTAIPCFDLETFARCDHPTRELAEWHFYEYEVETAREFKVAEGTRHRCMKHPCKSYTDMGLEGRYLFAGTFLCGRHRKSKWLRDIRPFSPGIHIAASW